MKLCTLTLTFTVMLLTACASSPQQALNEVMQQRPDWPMNEPEVADGRMYFVGLSAPHATEKNARRDALRDAADVAVLYLGTFAESKFREASRGYGLASEVVDPETSALGFREQVARNVITRQKSHKWYTERETDAAGKKGYKVFVLTSIPLDDINRAFDNTVEQNIANARKKQQEAMTEEARQQGQQAEEFWKSVRNQDEDFFQ